MHKNNKTSIEISSDSESLKETLPTFADGVISQNLGFVCDPTKKRKNWTLHDWQEKDQKALEIIKEHFPDKFKKLK